MNIPFGEFKKFITLENEMESINLILQDKFKLNHLSRKKKY